MFSLGTLDLDFQVADPVLMGVRVEMQNPLIKFAIVIGLKFVQVFFLTLMKERII